VALIAPLVAVQVAAWPTATLAAATLAAATLAATSGTQVLWHSGPLNTSATRLALPTTAFDQLAHGARATVVVRAVSFAGMAAAARVEVTADWTAPRAGYVFVGQSDLSASCIQPDDTIQIWWNGFEDATSGIASYEWGIGSAPLLADLMVLTPISVDDATTVLQTWFTPSPLAPGSVVFATVRATNGAGRSVTSSSPAVHVLPSNCSSTISCVPWPTGTGRPSNGAQVALSAVPPILAPLYLAP